MAHRVLIWIVLGLFCVCSHPLFGAPIVDSLIQNRGPMAGGNPVDIMGSGFTGVTAVNFGSTPASSFVFINDGEIAAVAPPGALSTVTVSVTTNSGTSPVSAGSYYAYQGDWIAYVTNQGSTTITPINTATNTPETDINLTNNGTSIQPNGIAITPNGSMAYISSFNNEVTGGGPLAILNIVTQTVSFLPIIGEPESSQNYPAITPDGKTVYLPVQAPGGSNSFVLPITIATNTPESPIFVGNTTLPQDCAISPDGQTTYLLAAVADGLDMIVISNATNTIQSTIFFPEVGAIGPPPITSLVITPNGTTVYVINGDLILPFSIPENMFVNEMTLPEASVNMAITPNGQTGYLTEMSGVIPFTIATNTPGTPIVLPTGAFTPGIAITPDGTTAYVANSTANTVTPITIATNTIGTPIPTGSVPFYIAITPDPSPIALFTASVVSVSPGSTIVPVNFDATASVTSVGTIVNYSWDFGDGLTASTPSPTIMHNYDISTSPGPFSVTLTVTNSAGTSTSQVFTGHTVSRNGGPSATTTQTVVIPPSPPAPTFPPLVTAINPTTGPVSGGTTVTITGSGFTGATSVKFGSSFATFVVNSDSSITAISPPGLGTVDVLVTTSAGTSLVTQADRFTYFSPPSNFKGKIIKREFATQTEYIHRLTWDPSPDVSVVSYRLFRNGRLIATIPAQGPFAFNDHNRKKCQVDVYTLVAINSNGLESQALIVRLP